MLRKLGKLCQMLLMLLGQTLLLLTLLLLLSLLLPLLYRLLLFACLPLCRVLCGEVLKPHHHVLDGAGSRLPVGRLLLPAFSPAGKVRPLPLRLPPHVLLVLLVTKNRV
jgi:hypothetical protein